jgi:hypothetical protein
VEITLRHKRSKEKTLSVMRDPFETKKGLQYRYILTCVLFNTALEKGVREANWISEELYYINLCRFWLMPMMF